MTTIRRGSRRGQTAKKFFARKISPRHLSSFFSSRPSVRSVIPLFPVTPFTALGWLPTKGREVGIACQTCKVSPFKEPSRIGKGDDHYAR